MINTRSQVQIKILNYFFLNEKERVYINELARVIQSDPKNVYRILLRLEEEGILKSEFRGKERYFFTNADNPIYRSYKDIFIRTSGIDIVLKKALKKVKGVKEAYIYGSYAKGRFEPHSDIDMIVIGSHSVLSLQKELNRIQKDIGREINAINIDEEEFAEKMKKKGSFVADIFAQKTIKVT